MSAALRVAGRVLLGAAGVVVALWALVNVAVHSNAIESIINNTQKDVTLTLDADWLWWPGHIDATNFQLLVHDPAVQAELDIAELSVDWNPLELLQKRFHATTASVSGVRFRLRLTRFVPQLCAQPAGLPAIPGLSVPPDQVQGDCEAQPETARPAGPKPTREKVFSVQLDRVDAEGLEEVWIERIRATGSSDFTGQWSFVPTFETSTALERFESEPWQIAIADEVLAEVVTVSLRGQLDELDIRARQASEESGNELPPVASLITARTKVAARRIDLEAVAALAKVRASGHLDVFVDADIQSGRPEYASVDIQGGELHVSAPGGMIRGAPRIDVTVVQTSSVATVRAGSVHVRAFKIGEHHQGVTDLSARITPDSWVHVDHRRASLGLEAETTNIEPIMGALQGLPRAVIDLLVKQSAHIRASGRLDLDASLGRLEDLDVKAGPLKVDGRVLLYPKSGGHLRAQLGPVVVKKDIE